MLPLAVPMSIRQRLSRIVREPLLHFLVVGAALFGLQSALSSRTNDGGTIVITRGRIRSMAETFQLTWQRPPSPEELEGLVRDAVREEVLVREARRLGLDQDDALVRRRLRTKMEILGDEVARVPAPTEAELAEYLARHPEPFRREGLFTFTQVYLSPERRGTRLEADAAKVLERLRRSPAAPAPERLGDPLLLDARFERVPERQVDAEFGHDFTRALSQLPQGTWSGPVSSSYGTHLVRLEARIPSRPATLAEARSEVERAWSSEATQQARERDYRELLSRVRVVVEPVEPAEAAVPRAGR